MLPKLEPSTAYSLSRHIFKQETVPTPDKRCKLFPRIICALVIIVTVGNPWLPGKFSGSIDQMDNVIHGGYIGMVAPPSVKRINGCPISLKIFSQLGSSSLSFGVNIENIWNHDLVVSWVHSVKLTKHRKDRPLLPKKTPDHLPTSSFQNKIRCLF